MQSADFSPAAPQQAPKHLTDEELKQQYGIHLATRIQADGDGKEAKWADIDDDEDDWAPETIEWNDGTKIDLSQNDSAKLLAEQQAIEEAARKRQEEEKKAKAAAEKKPTTSVGPNATVLKPRSAAQPKPGSPLVLKTPTEKPTLVSKPSAATPAKSPWAALPAVDKVPPVDINPPVVASPQRSLQNGIQQTGPSVPPPQPAMEIAADSFKRGGTETQRDSVGRLFNAQSGVYEPANATGGRRGSMRKDGNFRATSVLQRGGTVQDGSTPAEPSAAFQTRRLSQNEHTPWDRRKSSTVSGESGRRQSISERRGSHQSQAIQSPIASAAPGVDIKSPIAANAQLAQEGRAGPGQAYHARGGSNNVTIPTGSEDAAHQKKVMKEKRELAIKRRKEQEEKEEAEKKERIRKKLEAMGEAPAKKEPAKEAQTMKIEKRPSEPVKAESADVAKEPQPPEQSKPAAVSPSLVAKSPPKPPAPNASGAPQQYGLMKLHSSAPRDPMQQVTDTLMGEKAKLRPTSQQASPSDAETRAEAIKDPSPPMTNGVGASRPSESIFQRSPELSGRRISTDGRPQPWNDMPRDSKLYAGWNPQQNRREPSNVWGPVSPSQSLGNGAFDRTIQRPQSRHQDSFPSSALAPIGPPRTLQQAKDPRDIARGGGKDYQALGMEDSQTIPSFPSSENQPSTRMDGQRPLENGDRVSPPQESLDVQGLPGHGGPQRPLSNNQREAKLAAWANFQATDRTFQAEQRRKYDEERRARLEEEARTGVSQAAKMPIAEETWKQVKVDDKGTGRSIVNVSKTINNPALQPGLHMPMDMRNPSFVSAMDGPGIIGGSLGRSSRFFPAAGRLQPYPHAAAPFAGFYRRSDSPPPPDERGHPVYDAESRRVVVRLPSKGGVDPTPPTEAVDPTPSRGGVNSPEPPPKVRLPPSSATSNQTLSPSTSQPPSTIQPIPKRIVSQPLVNSPSWQDRFDGLFGGKKSSPPKKSAQLVGESASTREPLDSPAPRMAAAVALPPPGKTSGSGTLEVLSGDCQDEEALFEPEAGSTPTVIFPKQTRPTNPWMMNNHMHKPMVPSREPEAVTKAILDLPALFSPQNLLLVFIHLQGMAGGKSKPLRSSQGHYPPHDNVHAPSQHHHEQFTRQQNFQSHRQNKHSGKSYKNRETSSSFSHAAPNPKFAQGNGNNQLSQKGPNVNVAETRNNYQHRSNGQDRNSHQPLQQQSVGWEGVGAEGSW